MKKFLLVAALAAFFVQANAQNDNMQQKKTTTTTTTTTTTVETKDVPNTVVTTFQGAYPDVTGVTWRKSGTYYVADYNKDNNEMYVTYDPTGKVIESGEGMVTTSVPSSMTTYVKTKYKDGELRKVYKIKNAKGDVVYKGKVNDTYLIFDSQGNYLRTEKRMAYGDWDK